MEHDDECSVKDRLLSDNQLKQKVQQHSNPLELKVLPRGVNKQQPNVENNECEKNYPHQSASTVAGDMDQIIITYKDENNRDIEGNIQRDSWGGKLEFILTCIGFAVGLGNVWRFPYLCLKNGGGAFLIPYFFMLATVGLPLFFLELAFGQFASLGPISIWSISPLFKGVGFGMVIISGIVSVYYNVVISQCFLFFFASMTSVLPWSTCDNWWNQPQNGSDDNRLCHETRSLENGTLSNFNNTVSASEQYYENYVLRKSTGITDMGLPIWHMSLCLLLAWLLVTGVLIKGVQSLGKVAYFTAIFPYIMLTILLLRGVFLPGAADGIRYYLTPNFSRLKDPRVWTDAATQIFFSLSCCNGGLITMSSYNKFKNNCCRDAVLVAILNCATSFYAGFVIFSNLGFMAHLKQTTVEQVAKGGPGLAFIVYPEALSNMPFLPPFWAVCFFLMMITLGLGSQFSIVETVLSGFQDELRKCGWLKKSWHIVVYRIGVCTLLFLLGLSMVTPGGMYLLNLVDSTISGYPLLVMALAEIIVLCYLYDIRQFLKDIEMMTGSKPNWYWRITWCGVSPLIIVGLLIFNFIENDNVMKLGKYLYPNWANQFSILLAIFPVLFVPGILCWRFCREGGFILFRELLKPKYKWGPAEKKYREDFLRIIQESAVKFQEPFIAEPPHLSNLSLGMAPTDLRDGGGFFQSKLSVAQKISRAASKESGMNQLVLVSQTNLAASQPGGLNAMIPADLVEKAAMSQPKQTTFHIGTETDTTARI